MARKRRANTRQYKGAGDTAIKVKGVIRLAFKIGGHEASTISGVNLNKATEMNMEKTSIDK